MVAYNQPFSADANRRGLFYDSNLSLLSWFFSLQPIDVNQPINDTHSIEHSWSAGVLVAFLKASRLTFVALYQG